jgi:hypothetical protein
MPFIQYPVTRIRQPQSPVGVNWTNPITQGLVQLLLFSTSAPNSVIDLVQGNVWTGTGMTRRPTPQGLATGDNSYSGYKLTSGKSFNFGNGGRYGTNNFSVVLGTYFPGSLLYLPEFFTFDAASYSTTVNCNASDSGQVVMIVGGTQFFSAAGTIAANKHVNLGWSYAGTSGEIYADGRSVLTGTGSNISTTAKTPQLHLSNDLTGRAPGGYMTHFAIWDRRITGAEHAALGVNPWQLFAPLPRRIWIAPTTAIGGASNAPRYFHRTQAGQA